VLLISKHKATLKDKKRPLSSKRYDRLYFE